MPKITYFPQYSQRFAEYLIFISHIFTPYPPYGNSRIETPACLLPIVPFHYMFCSVHKDLLSKWASPELQHHSTKTCKFSSKGLQYAAAQIIDKLTDWTKPAGIGNVFWTTNIWILQMPLMLTQATNRSTVQDFTKQDMGTLDRGGERNILKDLPRQERCSMQELSKCREEWTEKSLPLLQVSRLSLWKVMLKLSEKFL